MSHEARNGSLHLPLKPRSVEQITKSAQDYDYSALVGIRYWLRTARTLLKEADIYEREGDDEQTYFLLFRHAHLILAHLAAHPEAHEKSSKTALEEAQRDVNRNLKRLDILKPKIKRRYERYVQLVREREERPGLSAERGRRKPHTTILPPQHDLVSLASRQHLEAGENGDLAVQVARKEISRRAGATSSASQYGRVPQAEQTGGALLGYRQKDDPGRVHSLRRDNDELSQSLQEVRTQVAPWTRPTADEIQHRSQEKLSTISPGYNYPSVPLKHEPRQPDQHALSTELRLPTSREALPPPLAPSVPPKSRTQSPLQGPPHPEKTSSTSEQAPSGAATATSTESGAYTFAATASLENGETLRTLFLPPTLRSTFLSLASANTNRNLETCAFLAGTLISNALFVSKLILPAQTATSDTCEMTPDGESALFDFVDSFSDLMVVGWIHTHPSQTCFMSSRDLHTHSGYQMMLQESVAIVCAPSKGNRADGGDWGVYRLTDPPGKKTILACGKPGIFHAHEVDNLYTDALRPGHVVEARGLEFEVVDLRDDGG